MKPNGHIPAIIFSPDHFNVKRIPDIYLGLKPDHTLHRFLKHRAKLFNQFCAGKIWTQDLCTRPEDLRH